MKLLCLITAGAVGWLAAASIAPAEAGNGEPRLTVAATAAESVVFDWDTDRCVRTDIPDAPPRAFRDFTGRVHLMATHDDNRAFVGADFDHLSHPCAVIYEGDHSDDPSKFDDRQWLTAFVTDDGRKILALVHDEFQGDLRPALCPSRKYLSCWYNSITFATSDDGGDTFHQLPAPANVVAAPSVPYAADAGHPIGYFQPTNIVRKDSAFYFMFLATAAGSQTGGICVARSTDVSDPASWRAWDGSGFNVRLAGPYRDPAAAGAHTCAPVGKGALFELGSLAYDRSWGLFVYLGAISIGKGDAAHPPGAYYSTSQDLLSWSPPVQLFRSPPKGDGPGKGVRYGLFSLIDEASDTPDFRDISSYDHLYLYYVKFDLGRQPYARVLAKKQVTANSR
jgi:hypothetical protein